MGARSESLDLRAWDAAVSVYAKTRLEVGSEVDITDPAVPQAGQWRDALYALHPIEELAPTLRLTG